MAKTVSKNPSAGVTAPADETLPLFFKQPIPLTLDRHREASLLKGQELGFAAKTNSILINAIEFVDSARQYPIVFTQTEIPMPAVILGLEEENYFIDAKGRWRESAYIPAYVRKYPFIFMNAPEQNRFLLCVDENAPQYKKTGGKNTLPLYNQNGKPSELTRNALEFCTAFHNHYQITREFCQALKAADLLSQSRSNAKLANGRQINLSGFQVIDEKKLQALSDDKVLAFHKKGWLPLIYFALMSSSNWKKLANMASEKDKGKSTAKSARKPTAGASN